MTCSNPDFIWSNEYPVNRFAQGAFKTCLECLYKKLTKEHLISTKFGKPEKITYEFATKILNDHANAMWGLPKDTSRRIVYAIGGWESVLVRTGVWNEVDHHRKHDHNSTLVKSDVLEAVEFILRKEKLY
ncbi:hypothetical protein HK099_002423 [Clydaea vesicula]|uniref:Uncharacterized protein n=1 Tax=Clydaea vesicula TaxID=447962 RepID=A0AAD5Y3T0_9FUNG|nr:hypothetical protein HK099_002423 [Clydaea vesicula]